MKNYIFYILPILFFCFDGQKSYPASIKNTGYSIVKNYYKENYGAATQNWNITQDKEGIMYFANSKGLLQFDGNNWNLYPLPNKSIVRAVCVDNDGKIWVGGFNQLGFYSPDDKGELVFTYMVKLLEPQYRDFGEIWRIFNDNDRLLIQTFTAIFEYKDGLLRPLIWNVDLHYSFYVNNSLFVKVNNAGLYKLVNNELIPVKNGEIFSDIVISSIISINAREFFIITATEGIFLMDESGISKLQLQVNDFLIQNQVFDAIAYENYILIGTIQDGLLILDNKCNAIQHINRERGLQNNTILSLFIDREKNLWLGLDNGIDYVKVNSPLSLIANKEEVGAGYQALLYNNKLFLGSNQGLYSMSWPENNPFYSENNLVSIPGLQGQVWMIKSFEDFVYCGHDKGTFIVSNNNTEQISEIAGSSNLLRLPGTDYLIQGTYSGLIILEKIRGTNKWNFRNKVEGFTSSCKNLIIDDNDNLWVGHGYKGIYKLTLTKDYNKVLKQKHYGKEQGLPENFGLNLLQFEDQMVISSEFGYYYYNKEKDYFLPHETLNNTFKQKIVTTFISDPNNKNTWFFSTDIMGIIKPNFDGSYNTEYIPFIELSGKFLSTFESIYFLDNTSIIISTEDGFVHFDPTFKKKYNYEYKALIRKVYNSADSLLYGGNYLTNEKPDKKITIKYNRNSLKFVFAAPIFDSPKPNNFSYFLEGFDKEWTDWSESSKKEYTNLPAGNYTFHLKSISIYGFESAESQLNITILPPWYQTWLAFVLYILASLFIIFILIMYILRRFEKEKLSLKEKQTNELKEREKEFERENIKAEQEIIKLRNENLVIDNQRKQSEIESKTKELASIAMHITYKNEMLEKVRQKLSKVTQKMIHQESKQQVEALIRTLEKDMVHDDEWEKFEISFDQVHEDFLKKLRTNFTDLSPKDLRLCAYLRMNLSSKEIAPLLNISIRGVEISRYRLRRKLYIDRDTNLTEFMMNL